MNATDNTGRKSQAETQRVVPDWDGLWDYCPETDSPVTEIQGKLPAGLVGTLYRNGPAKRQLADNFMDGDGMIRKITIRRDGTVHYRSRYVRTEKYLKEIDANAPQVRVAGTQLPGGAQANAMQPPYNQANTHVTLQGGKLHALYEGGPAVEMDPETLDTVGNDFFGGAIPETTMFSAHPHFDPETGDMFNFGVDPVAALPILRTYRWTKTGQLEGIRDLEMPFYGFLHDFAVTERWMVFIIPPLAANFQTSMSGEKSFFDSLEVLEGRGSIVYLVPKDGSDVIQMEVDSVSLAHVIAARDDGDDVVVDFVRPTQLDAMFDDLREFRTSGFTFIGKSPGSWRYRFNTRRRFMQCEQLDDRPVDFPRYDERLPMHKARYAYMGANPAEGVPGLYRGALKMDLQSGETGFFDLGPGHVAQEPILVPDPDGNAEDDGWLIGFFHDAARAGTNLYVLDARCITDGPVCVMQLPAFAGMTFHGSWVGA